MGSPVLTSPDYSSSARSRLPQVRACSRLSSASPEEGRRLLDQPSPDGVGRRAPQARPKLDETTRRRPLVSSDRRPSKRPTRFARPGRALAPGGSRSDGERRQNHLGAAIPRVLVPLVETRCAIRYSAPAVSRRRGSRMAGERMTAMAEPVLGRRETRRRFTLQEDYVVAPLPEVDPVLGRELHRQRVSVR